MKAYVNLAKKKEIARSKSKPKTVLFLKKIEKVIAVIFGLVVILYLLSAFKERNVSDMVSKLTGLFIVSFLWLIINRIASNISSKDILERKDEEISLSDREIKYVFRLRNQTKKNSRYVVAIDLGSENQFEIDCEDKKILFTGKCVCKNIEKYGTKYENVVDEKFLSEFIIYDYFEPSLIINLNKDRRN